jgi:hypothetical protein
MKTCIRVQKLGFKCVERDSIRHDGSIPKKNLNFAITDLSVYSYTELKQKWRERESKEAVYVAQRSRGRSGSTLR